MNPMMCDLKTGICGEAGEAGEGIIDFSQPREKVDLYYVTDPICSHCWALEPVLRRFVMEYGAYLNVRTVMGGLLNNWARRCWSRILRWRARSAFAASPPSLW